MPLYQEIRAAGKSMHHKVMEAGRNLNFNIRHVAKRMTLPTAGRTLIFDSEATQNAFLDFWFHEFRLNAKSMVESADPVMAALTPLELEVLEAHRRSHTSLFLAEAVLLNEHKVRMQDLLEPERPQILLTDIGFSQSLSQINGQLAVFFRLVTVRGVMMTSGFNFGFRRESVPGLLQAYRHKMKHVPPQDLSEQRFVFFFQKHRQCGLDQAYQDVI
jgi:hypothetical protein